MTTNIAINPVGWKVNQTATGLQHLNTAVRAGNQIWVAGMLAMDTHTGALVGEGDIEAQTRCVLDAIKAVLEEAGSSMDHVVMNQIFLRNLEDYHKFNDIYVSYFPNFLPARYCVKLEMVRPEFLVEIATTAVIPE